MNNLANNPEYPHVIKELKTQLADWCKMQGDTIRLKPLFFLCD